MDTPGRNAPCPCGSGKKYKACCMRGKVPRGLVGGITGDKPARATAGSRDGELKPVAPQANAVPVTAASMERTWRKPRRAREMDPETLEAIEFAVAELRLKLAREHGVVVRQEKHTYSGWNSRVEFVVAVEREDGIVMDGLAESFLERCGDYGLLPGDLGRPFRSGGGVFRITGLRPRAKVPILCERIEPKPDGRVEFRFAPEDVRHFLHGCSAQERGEEGG